jgi:hypothetical protein
MDTPQVNAVKSANQLASLMGQYIQFMKAANAWLADNDRNTWESTWANLPTAATNADGTIGAADQAPTSGRLITVPAGSPLLMSRNQLVKAKDLLTTLQTLYTQAGGTVAAPAQPASQIAASVAPNSY